MTDISVRLEIKSLNLLHKFQDIIRALEGVSLNESQESDPDTIIIQVPEIFLTSSFAPPYEVVMQVMRMGIREFFLEPVEKEEVEIAFARFKNHFKSEKSKKTKHGRVLSILGSKGGIGSTTVAVNLATGLAQTGEEMSVALVDLNLHFGDVSIFLNVEPTYTMAQISQGISRLNPLYLKSSLTKHSSGVYILPSSNNPEEVKTITPENVKQILGTLRDTFNYTVIDVGRSFNQVTMAALNLSETVFLVSLLDSVVLRNAKAILDLFLNLDYKDKIKIIINRYQKKCDVSLEETQKILKHKVFWLIPSDNTSMTSSINYSKPIVSYPNGKVTQSLKELALTIQGKEAKKKQKWRCILDFLNFF